MDRPPSPLFVPAKSGVDAETQVVVGELFDFDLEVSWVRSRVWESRASSCSTRSPTTIPLVVLTQE